MPPPAIHCSLLNFKIALRGTARGVTSSPPKQNAQTELRSQNLLSRTRVLRKAGRHGLQKPPSSPARPPGGASPPPLPPASRHPNFRGTRGTKGIPSRGEESREKQRAARYRRSPTSPSRSRGQRLTTSRRFRRSFRRHRKRPPPSHRPPPSIGRQPRRSSARQRKSAGLPGPGRSGPSRSSRRGLHAVPCRVSPWAAAPAERRRDG